VTGEADGKSEGANDGKGCASNQQKINGEYKTAQAIQHGTSHYFQFRTLCLARWFPGNRRKSESLVLAKVPPKKTKVRPLPWYFPGMHLLGGTLRIEGSELL
jgi:hypothetical protein